MVDARSRVLYLHGFASSPHGSKVSAIRAALEQNAIEVFAPDLNVPSFRDLDFRAMVAVGLDLASQHDPSVIVGSSLGAIVALGVARRAVDCPLILIAPALGSRKTWVERLPDGDPIFVHHHGENREMPIRRSFFQQMAEVDLDDQPPIAPVTVFMGLNDEVLCYERVKEVWDTWQSSGSLDERSRFVAIVDGDHRLIDQTDSIADEIRLQAVGEVDD